jgi:uncharacterized protein YkwD
MPAKLFLHRILPAVAVAASLFVAPGAAHAAAKKGGPTASIALGDKRPARARLAQSAPCQNTDLVPTAQNVDLIRAALLCLHNQVRAQYKLPALKLNTKLQKAGATHSSEMVEDGYFDHTSPDGTTFVERILDAGYAKPSDGWTLGENLAWGTGDLSTPAGVMNAWMNSPGHKANILKRDYKEIGFGIKLGVPSDDSVGATISAEFGAKD